MSGPSGSGQQRAGRADRPPRALRRGRRRLASGSAARGVLVLALAGALAGCGTGSGHQAARHAGTPKAAATPGGQPATGTKLLTLMPTNSELPRGWYDTGAANQPYSSGPAYQQAAPASWASLPHAKCGKEGEVDPVFFMQGFDVSYAVQPLDIHTIEGNGTIVVAGYHPGWAGRQFALIRAYVQRCSPVPIHYRDEITNALVTMNLVMHPVSGFGDQAVLVTSEQTNGLLPGHQYYPGDYLIVAQAGDYLIEVDANYMPNFDPAAQVRSIVSRLISKVRALG